MSVIDNTPSNRNFLSPVNFAFRIKKAPFVNFFIQQISIPAISVTNIDIRNEHVTAPYPGEHLTFAPLKLEFLVDEDLINYLEIHNWITALGKPDSYQQYKDIQDIPDYTGDGIYSDVSLFVLNSLKAQNYEIVFTDAFPISLSELNFDTRPSDIKFITATAVFKYTQYTITSL